MIISYTYIILYVQHVYTSHTRSCCRRCINATNVRVMIIICIVCGHRYAPPRERFIIFGGGNDIVFDGKSLAT